MSQAANAPMATPLATVALNTVSVWPSWCDTMASKINTANSAPRGSMTMPSQRSVLAMRAFGRSVRSIGITTVGPVTQARAPNRKAMAQSTPATRRAASASSNSAATAP